MGVGLFPPPPQSAPANDLRPRQGEGILRIPPTHDPALAKRLHQLMHQDMNDAGTYQINPAAYQHQQAVPHVTQRLAQMQQVAPFLGHNFELLLERQGLTNPAAAYKVVSQAFNQHAQAAGVAPRTLLMQLLAQKRMGNPKLDGKYPA